MQQEARISAARVKKNRIWNRGKYIFLKWAGVGGGVSQSHHHSIISGSILACYI
jgi:hypothetical protein